MEGANNRACPLEVVVELRCACQGTIDQDFCQAVDLARS